MEMTDLLIVLLTSGSVPPSRCSARLERVITPADTLGGGVDTEEGVVEDAKGE